MYNLYNRQFRITQGFSAAHHALDLVPGEGRTLSAPVSFPGPENGTVVFQGWNRGGYGNVLVIRHADGTGSLYAHLHTAGAHLQLNRGDVVRPGQIIANIGQTGDARGAHLHYERLPQGTLDTIARNAGNGRLGVAPTAPRLRP